MVQNIAGGQNRWKLVEPLIDANQVHIQRITTPTVVAVVRFLRGVDESVGLKNGEMAFLVVYPDIFDEPSDDARDVNQDAVSYYRFVKYKEVNSVASIDIGGKVYDFRPCREDQGNPQSPLHPWRRVSQAQYATCDASMMSAEAFASLFSLPLDSARLQARRSENTVRRRVLVEQLAFFDSTMAQLNRARRLGSPSLRTTFGSSGFLEWTGMEGVWITCGLGCCYARPPGA
jgi:hypothetical protein